MIATLGDWWAGKAPEEAGPDAVLFELRRESGETLGIVLAYNTHGPAWAKARKVTLGQFPTINSAKEHVEKYLAAHPISEPALTQREQRRNEYFEGTPNDE